MAKKNEARIKFTAETGEFNEAIKKSNNQLSELRAEMKLNAEQMADTGRTAEGLQQKHKLLQAQLDAASDKVEALAGKLQSAEKYFGANSDEASKLRVQLTNARTAQAKLERAVNDCSIELQEFTREMADAGSEAKETRGKFERLSDEIDDQQSNLKALKEAYADAVLEYGKGSTEAKDLAKQIRKLSGELRDNQTKMGKAERAADKLDTSFDDAGDAARNAAEDFSAATVAVGSFVSDAFQAGLDKVSEFVGYLGGLPEETRESRQSMAVLGTAFEGAGFSAEQGKKTVRELYGVLGDNDRAVEASTLFSKMCDDQEDLNKWVTISTGIFGTYGESLPVESLAEAANETSKTGVVTGTLADALNWSSEAATMFAQYMSEDVTTAEDAFNVALSECTTEQERQTLITETLNALYGDAATKYEESAGSMIDANKAAFDLSQTENKVAESIEPVTTAWDGMKNQLLTAAIPAIESVSGALTTAFNWLQEHPAVLYAVSTAFGVLAVGLGILAGVWMAYTVVQTLANAAMLPVIGIAVLIVAAIAAVIAIGVLLYQNWDEIKAKCIEVWDSVKEKVSTVVENVKTAVMNAWNNIKTGTSNAFNNVKNTAMNIWQALKTAVSDAVNGLKTGVLNVWNTIKTGTSNAFNNVKNTASNIWNMLKTNISNVVTGAKDAVTNAWDTIKNKTGAAFINIKSTATRLWNSIKTAITTPIETAKTKVKNVIDAIKGFFDFTFTWPHIPLPHFGIQPPGWQIGDLLKGSIPTLGIEWYAAGGIMTKPTVFGMNGNNAMVGGEAGPEAILPISKLEDYIANAVEQKMGVVNLEALANSIQDLATRPIAINVNGRQIALATAGDGDSVNGLRSTFKSRGLALD